MMADPPTREQLRGQIQQAEAELASRWAELDGVLARVINIRGPLEKKKPGRPSIWRGRVGFCLVMAVEEILAQEDRRRSVAQAIRMAVKTNPILSEGKAISRLSDRALQARYQQAADYWSKSRSDDLDSELGAVQRRIDDACDHVNFLKDAYDAL